MATDGRGLRRLHAPLDGYIDSVEWSRDGRWLSIAPRSLQLGQCDLRRAGDRHSARRIATGSFAVAWLTARTLVLNLAAGVTGRDISGKDAVAAAGRLDRRRLRTRRGRARRQRPASTRHARGVRRTTIRGRMPALWSPDGTLLAYTHPSGGIRLLDLRNRVRVLAPRLRLAGGWAPDGRSLLAADQDTSFRPVSVALDGRTTSVGVNNGKWSQNGRLLLGAGEGGRVSVWRPGSKARFLTAPPRQEPCPTYYNTFEWLDHRRVVLELGRGGQQDTNLWVARRRDRRCVVCDAGPTGWSLRTGRPTARGSSTRPAVSSRTGAGARDSGRRSCGSCRRTGPAIGPSSRMTAALTSSRAGRRTDRRSPSTVLTSARNRGVRRLRRRCHVTGTAPAVRRLW